MPQSKAWHNGAWVSGVWKVWHNGAWVVPKTKVWHNGAWIEAGGTTFTVTIGSNLTSSQFGFSIPDGYGSISPAAYQGITISFVYSPTSTDDIRLGFVGGVTGGITGIRVEDQGGTMREYLAADGIHNGSYWSWGAGTNRVWTASIGGPQRQLIIF